MNYFKVLAMAIIAMGMFACTGKHVEHQSTQSDTSVSANELIADTLVIREEVIDSTIVSYMHNINAQRGNWSESLDTFNKELLDYLTAICSYPEVLNYEFTGADTVGMSILTSEDKKFRIYCWDTETGGTMRFYNSIFQYRTGSGSKFVVANDISAGDLDAGAYYYKMHTIKPISRPFYYLALYMGIGSSRDMLDGIRSFAIKGDNLDHSIKVFQTTKTILNDISYYYDAVHSHIYETEQTNEIELSSDKQTLYIPVVDENYGKTNRRLTYKFDGERFVYQKNAR
jgi:hypothetical protein